MLWIPLKEVKKGIPCHAEKGINLFFLYLDVLVEQIAKYKEQFVQAVQEVCLDFMSVKLSTRKYLWRWVNVEGAKKVIFYSLPFGQAEANIY